MLHATDCKPFKNWQYIMYKIFIDKNQRAVVCVVGRDMLTINTTFKEFSIIQLLQDLTELSWNYNYLFSKHFAQSISRDHSQKQYCNEDWKLTKDKDKDSSEISNFFNDLQRQEFLQKIKDFRNLWILKMDQSQRQRFINFNPN